MAKKDFTEMSTKDQVLNSFRLFRRVKQDPVKLLLEKGLSQELAEDRAEVAEQYLFAACCIEALNDKFYEYTDMILEDASHPAIANEHIQELLDGALNEVNRWSDAQRDRMLEPLCDC